MTCGNAEYQMLTCGLLATACNHASNPAHPIQPKRLKTFTKSTRAMEKRTNP